MKHYPLLTEHTSSEAVILGNGDYPSHPLPLTLLQQADRVICCDGAANEYIRHGHTPFAIVGDGDSLSPENRERFADRLYLSRDQESNDQTKAVRFCLARKIRQIVIVGATGKREDHTLGNISLLMDYMHQADVQLVTDHGIFVPVQNSASFECRPGGQVSLINFGAVDIRGEGLAYPLSDFTNWWQGTLNEATQEIITIHAQGSYLLFRSFS